MAIGDALKSVEERAEALKQEVKNLSQSKSDLDVELKQAEQALAHVRSEEAGLRTQAEESRADLAESQTELAKVTETLDEMAQRRDKLSTAIGQLQQQRESLERECTAKEQTLGVLKTQCSHMEQQIEEFDRKLQEFNTSVNECPEIIAMEKTIADKQNQLHSIKEETARQVDRFRRVEAKLERTLQWLKNNGIALDDQYVPHRSTPTYYRAGSASTLEQPSTSTTGPLTGPDTRANLDPFSAEQLRVLERTADDLLRPAEALRADALRSEALRADALRSEALRADALRSEALRSEALRSEALRSEALRSEALRSAATLRSETPHTLLRPTDHAFAHQHSSLPDNQFELLQGFRSDGTGRRLFPVHAEWATSDDQRRYGFADTATNSVAKESSIGEWK
ncbi:synaptonemal complex protein 1 [Gregarina niphandrodes]|uniref:Synaptonemal complex protein 1 n=1 Tax=Gregarina niphandrodes TaxID=110365 RepID=A0A023BA93_GRENI|nr:synaptonemal complex protein 1 [Gregarina niphandrodes]EZG78169.1 synaptonemal complex protein 1 [Gregarina niphandrodes]|eukprot:XP_011129434.1 synaptonemal complex protein 1 [Gregarina niphandrodes]